MRIAHQKWKVRKSTVTFQNRKKEKLQKGSRKLNPAFPFLSLFPTGPLSFTTKSKHNSSPLFCSLQKKTLLLFLFFYHLRSQLQMPILLFLFSPLDNPKDQPLVSLSYGYLQPPLQLEAWLPKGPVAWPNVGCSGVSMGDQPLQRGLRARYGVTAW